MSNVFFIGDTHFGHKGLGNLHSTYETKEEAEAVAAELNAGKGRYDDFTVEVENVSDLLGLKTEDDSGTT